ncbi:hypothetical protein [Nocardia lasii]|uniref:Uncharacterized protein n=1 Tax=Nocardia lasii TaxID=1616107 RepID=A0ABW1JU05_9NOCA
MVLCLFVFSAACGETSATTDCGIAEQVYQDSEVVLGRINVAMDPNNPEFADYDVRDDFVAAGYNELAQIAEKGAESMSAGAVREATRGMVQPFRAGAEFIGRADKKEGDGDIPVMTQKLEDIGVARQAFFDSCDTIPPVRSARNPLS